MKKNKIGVIFLVSVLALAGIGMSYAGFTDVINVSGSVDTATVELTVFDYSGTWVYKVWGWTDPDNPPAGPASWKDLDITWDPANEVLICQGLIGDKPTASMLNIWLAGTGAQWDDISYAEAALGTTSDVDMVWNNIFPCIDFTADVIIQYTGSIPAQVDVTDLIWDTTGVNYDFSPYTRFQAHGYNPDPTGKVGSLITFPVQMHEDDYVAIEVTIHLPQLPDDSLQGKLGECSFNIEAIQWNECDQTTEPKEMVLPVEPIQFKAWFTNYNGGDYYSCAARLFNLPPGVFNVQENGLYTLWCCDQEPVIYVGTYEGNAPTYTATLFSSYDPNMPARCMDPDWDKVNWIINHKGDYQTATGRDIQEAIWFFKDGGATPTNQIGQDIVADAIANGNGFVPGPGQLEAVIVYVGGDVQDTFIEVDP